MRERAPLKTLIGIIEKDYRQHYFKKYRDQSVMQLTGRQRTRVKEILGVVPLSELRRRLRRYFEDGSGWLRERRHPWNVFVSGLDQYAGGGNNGQGEGGKSEDWIKDEIEKYERRQGG